MATFGLVHGGMHGSWCWELLVPELERRNHAAVTVDLPCSDPDAGCLVYARTCVEAFAGAPEDLVVVGHSLGGLTIPLVATLRPVRRLVFLCALVPRPGRRHADALAEEPGMLRPAAMGERTVTAARTHVRSEEQAIAAFYHDVPPDLARRAVVRLRPQAQTPMTEVTPLAAMPQVATTYVMGDDDRCIAPDWARERVPQLLGVTPVALPGGHSPFLARPAALAEILDAVVAG